MTHEGDPSTLSCSDLISCKYKSCRELDEKGQGWCSKEGVKVPTTSLYCMWNGK